MPELTERHQLTPARPLNGPIVAAVAATIGVIYGYDTGGIAGALVYIKAQYHLGTLWLSVVTSIVVVGSLIGAVIGPWMANTFGRKVTMLVIAGGFTAFAALAAVPWGIVWLTGVRLFLGVTVGLSTVVAPIFISEFAQENQRGRLATSYQFFTSAGVVVSLVLDWALAASRAWQVMLGISAIPAAAVLLLIARFPDSPRWYAMKGRYDDALRTLRRIDPRLAEQRITEIRADLAIGEHGRFREIFTRRYARATLFVIGFGFFVQITGNNTILVYSPEIFQKAGISSGANSILSAAIVQVFAIVGVVLSIAFVDRWGRRPPLLIGTAGAVAGQLLMMVAFWNPDPSRGAGYLAVAAIALFYVSFFFGIGSVIWVYTGEAFPARLRSVGAAALLITDFTANLIATFAFPALLSGLGGTATFGIFMILCVAAWIFMFKMAPETRGRSLEEIRGYWDNGGRWPRRLPAASQRTN